MTCKTDGKNYGCKLLTSTSLRMIYEQRGKVNCWSLIFLVLVTVNGRGKTLGAGNLEKAKAALKAQNINVELTPIEQSC